MKGEATHIEDTRFFSLFSLIFEDFLRKPPLIHCIFFVSSLLRAAASGQAVAFSKNFTMTSRKSMLFSVRFTLRPTNTA